MPTSTRAKKYSHGFTIVELLIVVVVIAILASITVVSYSGITARAKDAAVKSDVANIKKKFNLYLSTTDAFPSSSATAVADAQLGNGLGSKVITANSCTASPATKDSYCIYSDSSYWRVVYWSPSQAQWRVYSENIDGTTNEYSGGTGTYASLGN